MIRDLIKCIAILAVGFFGGLAMLNHIGGSNEAKKHVDVHRPVHGGRTSGAHLAAKALRADCHSRIRGNHFPLESLT